MKNAVLASASLAALSLALPPVAIAAQPRADASDPSVLIAQLNTAFAEFKTANDASLSAKVDDAVLTEKVETINAEITRIDEAINAALAKVAAGNLGDGDPVRDPEYTQEFNAYFKSGIETSNLNEVKAAATKTDGEGGFLAPVEWDRSISGRLKQISAIRQHANVQVISGAGFKKVFSDRNTGSGWVGETAARPATATPGLTSVDFPLGELYANPAASQGLIDDAEVDIEAWLVGEVEAEFARQEGIAFLSGDGVNKPHGILTYVTGGSAAARHPFGAIEAIKSGDAAKLTGDGLLDLIYALPEEFEANAQLFLNRTTAGAARKLKDGQGNYLWQPAFGDGQPSTIAGVPINHLPGMPVVGAGAIAALYGDMRMAYTVVDRIGTRVLRDPYTNKPFVHFYTTKRVGGGATNTEAMKALKISA